MIPATVLLGSMAAGGLGLYLSGSTGSEPSTGIAKTVEDSVTSIADQVSKTTQDVTEYVSPKEEAPETPEVTAPEPVAEPVPEPVEEQVPEEVPIPEEPVPEEVPIPEENPQGGQRGGFGRPTWAPLNAGTSLTQALGIVPGTPAGNALATATGSKTPQQIQQELVDIDEQIRALNASTFSLTREETQTNSDLSASRKALQDLEDEIFRNQKLITFLTGKINSTSSIQDTNVKLTKLVTDEVTPIFGGPPDNMQVGGKKKGKPGKPGGTGAFTPTDKQKEWLVKTLRYFRNLPDEDRDDDIPDLFRVENKKDLDREATGSTKIPDYTSETTLAGSEAFNLTKVPTDDAEKALAIKWWNFLRGKVHQEDIDPTKVQADLIGFMTQKRTYDDTLRQSEYKIPDAKEKTKEKEDELQEIRLKLSENKKKKKELEASRGLLLKELSSYKVPQSFWDKKEVRPSVLPTGEALNTLLIEYRQIEDDIARNEREKNDYVSIQLASDPSWTGDERYTEIIGRETALELKKSNKIAEIEGRAPSQLDQLKENPFQAFARELSRDKLTKQATELLLKTSFPEVFKMYFELSKASSDTIYDKVDKYYNFFKKGLQSFNGQDVSRAFVFFYGLGKEPRLSPELKTKVTNFSTLNKQIIANALTNLELALQGIKTPTVEERSIVEQALMSGESIPWKTLKRAGVALDVSHLFTKSVQQKLVILKDTFRERIYDKLKDVSIKYGLWGKQEISGYRQTIESSFDVYKALLVQEITTFNTLLATWEATDPKQREKQPINDSLTKIRGLARLVMSLLQEGDTLREELTTILDNSEYSSQFKGGAKLTLAEFKETLQRINVALQEPNNSRGLVVDGNKALFDQLVQAKAMIIKKNIYLSFAIRKDWSVKTKLDIANELLQAYDDLGKAFESLYQSQTTEKQASTLEKDFKEYGKARDELKKKIEQTEFDVKAKLAKEASDKEIRDLEDSTKDPSLLSIVNLSSKLVTILGGIIPSSSTASKVGSLAAYLFSGKVSVDDIKTALKNIGAFFSKFSWSSKITARPLPEDPKLSSIDKETLQDLVDAFSSLPPDIDSYENLPKSDLSSIFKTLVNSGRLVESLEALNPNVVNFKQQYEVLLDLIEEYADQERIPLTGGAGSAMDREARKRRKQVRKEIKEKQEKEDARLMSNYKRSQYRSAVNEVRKRSDYREKQLRGDIPFDEENQEQLLEERQEQTNSSGTPIGTLLEQLKRVLTLASTLAESQGISLSDNTFKPAVREEQKPPFDDEEEEELTKPVLTAESTDTTITLSWTAETDVAYTLEQDLLDVGVVTPPQTITDLTPNTSYSFKIIARKDDQTVESDNISVKTLETSAPGPTGPGPDPTTSAAADIIAGKMKETSARKIVWTNDVLKTLFPAKTDAEITPLAMKLNALNANTDLADDVLVYPSKTTFGEVRWTTLVNGNITKVIRLATEETIPIKGSEAERFLRKTIADALAATGPTGPTGPAPAPGAGTVPDTLEKLNTWIGEQSKPVPAGIGQDNILQKRMEKENTVKYVFLHEAEKLGSMKDKTDYAKTLGGLDEYKMIMNSGGGKNDCLIISFLMSVSPVYRTLDYPQKYAIASKLRRESLPTIIANNKAKLSLTDGRLQEYKDTFLSNNMLEDNDIGILTQLYDVNILSLESYKEQTFEGTVHKDYPKAHLISPLRDVAPPRPDGTKPEQKFRLDLPSIIIINRGNFHYESVEKEPDQYVFTKDELNALYTSIMKDNKYYGILRDSLPKNAQDSKYCVENAPPFIRIDDCKVGGEGYKVQTLDDYIKDHNLTGEVITVNGTRYLKAYRTEKLKYANDNPLTRVQSYDERMHDFFANNNQRAISNSKRPTTLEEWKRFGNEPSIGINLTAGKEGALGYSYQLVEEGNPNFSLKTFFIDIAKTKSVLSIRKRCTWAQITCDRKVNTTYDLIVHRDADNLEINILDQGRSKVDKVTNTKYILNPDDTKVAVEAETVLFEKAAPSPFVAPGEALMVGNFVKLKPVTSKTYAENGLLYKSRGRLKFGKITEIIGGTDARVQSYDLFPKSKIPTKGQPARYALVDLVKTTPQQEGVDPTIVFGGGYTRRQRVRGMPKRLKTRRTY